MMWWDDGMGWGGWAAMVVVMVSFWALVIFGLMAAFGRSGEDQLQARGHSSDPQDVLRERFARGEIDADEYHARQKILRTHQ